MSGLVGIGTTHLDLPLTSRLALIVMSGMPSASRQKFLTTSPDDGAIGGWEDGRFLLVSYFCPTALVQSGLIFVQEYDLNRELIASTIVMTSVLLLLIIPLGLALFA
jgi:predicted permease